MPRKKITRSSEGPFIHGADPFVDFRNTLYYVWKKLGLPPPTKLQYAMADFLQNGPKREVIEGYRGIGKSWILSTFVPHCLRTNNALNFLIISGNADRANAFSTFCLRLMTDIDIFQHLKPGEDAARHSMTAFDVNGAPPSHAPSVKSAGITGQITGSRADYIIADDIETPSNSGTVQQREKLSEQIRELDAIIKPNPSPGRVIYLGTPQSASSIYDQLPARGYVVRRFPSEYPTPARLRDYKGTLEPIIEQELARDPRLIGKPTDPDRFGELELAARKLSFGRTGYALQYLLDTTLSDLEKYPLKLADLIVTDLDDDMGPSKLVWSNASEYAYGNDLPAPGLAGDRFYRPALVIQPFIPYQACVATIDPSGRGKDELGYCVMKNINGQLFVPAFGGLRGGYAEENLMKLALLFKRHKVNEVIIEENFSDGMFTKLLGAVTQKVYPVTLTEIRHNRQKELRIIDTLEPVMNQHKLTFSRAAVLDEYNDVNHDLPEEQQQRYRLFYQLTNITKEKGCLLHDDRLDALAMAVAYYLEQMGVDVDRRLLEQQEERASARFRQFEDSIGQRRSPGGVHLPPHFTGRIGRPVR